MASKSKEPQKGYRRKNNKNAKIRGSKGHAMIKVRRRFRTGKKIKKKH